MISREFTFRTLYQSAKKDKTDAASAAQVLRFDQMTHVQPGSFLGRTLQQYEEILSHGGAPSLSAFLTEKKGIGKILDVGGSVGFALMQLSTLFPEVELHVTDIRNTLQNINAQTGNAFSSMHELFDLQFHQMSHLDLIRKKEYRNQFDLITCVAAAYEDDLLPYFLKGIYKLLSENGQALVYISISEEVFEFMRCKMKEWNINFDFYPANREVLARNGLKRENTPVMGTITMRK